MPDDNDTADPSKKTASDSIDTLKKRNYRKRKSSDRARLSEGEIEDSDEEINRVNLNDIRMAKKHKQDNIDADSDFSIDESSDEDKDGKDEDTKQLKSKSQNSDSGSTSQKDSKVELNEKRSNENHEVHIEKPKEKIDIWKKRTVGTVFDEALKRYYERKAARGS